MFSIGTAALVAIPGAHVVSQLAVGVADVGRDFLASLSDKPSETTEIGATESQSLAAKAPKAEPPANPVSLSDLLKSIQSLIANLSDDSDQSVTIDSIDEAHIKVTGDEPLASSVKRWTELHPEWVKDWQSHAASSKSSSLLEASSNKLSAKVSATSVQLNGEFTS